MTYHPEGGEESSLLLSDPAATEATLTDLQNNTCYTITVVTTAGEHRRESTARRVALPLQGMPQNVYLYIQFVIWKYIVPLHSYTYPSWSDS